MLKVTEKMQLIISVKSIQYKYLINSVLYFF